MSDERSKSAVPEVRSSRVHLTEGSFVQHGDTVYRIERQLDFESVTATAVESGRAQVLKIAELEPPPVDGKTAAKPRATDAITEEEWKVAKERYAIIEPLLKMPRFGRADVQHRAEEVKRDPSTLYRWIKRYMAYENVSGLVPEPRGWSKDKTRIPAHTEAVITEVIEDYYLSKRRPSARKTVREVERRCIEQGIKPLPAHSTVRARISRIPEEERLRRRGFGDLAQRLRPTPGHFPNADYPLAVVQIDHTLGDIMLVDDVYRLPIGRPWITLAIDVFSRMVPGYYLSFDAPSIASVGLCIGHSIIPKEEWLALHEVDASWPVWGVPNTIHADNAGEFRSHSLKNSCAKHGMHIEFRPVKRPHFGGHIERLLGTLMSEIHDLPGSTFSSPAQRKGYDSDKESAMTISEFEKWLVTLICSVYHRRKHSELGMSPLKKWEIGVFGNATVPGVGLPSRPDNRWGIHRDFMPAIERTVQRDGVTIESVTYYAECLRPWTKAEDPNNPRKTRKFVFRRDPRNIKTIWFFDPDLEQYFDVPTADQSRPSMSVWEWREVKEYLKERGIEPDNTAEILRALTELREQAEQAQKKTKRARRKTQRRREHQRQTSPAAPAGPTEPEAEHTPASVFSDEPIRSSWTIR